MPKSYFLTANRIEFLTNFGITGPLNVYCVFKLGDKIVTTTIAEDCGKYPQWNEPFQLNSFGTEKDLHIEVYRTDCSKKSKSTLLGQATVQICVFEGKHGQGTWVDLHSQTGAIGTMVIGCEPREMTPECMKDPTEDLKKKKLPDAELLDCTQPTREHMKLSKKLSSAVKGGYGAVKGGLGVVKNGSFSLAKGGFGVVKGALGRFFSSKSNDYEESKSEVIHHSKTSELDDAHHDNNEKIEEENVLELTEIDNGAQGEESSRPLLGNNVIITDEQIQADNSFIDAKASAKDLI
eukprot:CAMPEP_0176428300 /NCGR_PEP_ID=MMETSP0127-20121128/13070_1 /TAXON_ID=938130 /ORGANISM="Platyophrya macrostoma, Strain WH" /LENGTH=292 /DNA_ID=CAMNT_0017809961 /DNA_START=27 /DNA_END=905 /DNA_ORIENTATION=-